MRLLAQTRKIAKRILLGPDEIPQQCAIGLRDPQEEIAVELHSEAEPCDVTHCHTMACAAPFTICIGHQFCGARAALWLHFRRRNGSHNLLGKLKLRPTRVLSVQGRELRCFEVQSAINYCLPAPRLWMRYAHWAWMRWRHPPEVHLSMREAHAMWAYFICPRPVVLVTAAHGGAINIFPMNLMGPLGGGLFGFALNRTRPVTSLVRRAGRLALSSIPIEQSGMARSLGANHKCESVELAKIRFPTRLSPLFQYPIPAFSVRVRELEIIDAHELGSHTFFLASILNEDRCGNGLEYFMIHGVYEFWRLHHRSK